MRITQRIFNAVLEDLEDETQSSEDRLAVEHCRNVLGSNSSEPWEDQKEYLVSSLEELKSTIEILLMLLKSES